MPSVQSPRELDDLLAGQLVGRSIRQLQVLGVNSLKTVSPSADELVGEHVRSARCVERVIAISTTACEIRVDLQRIGRVTWLENADAWQLSSGVPLPTVCQRPSFQGRTRSCTRRSALRVTIRVI